MTVTDDSWGFSLPAVESSGRFLAVSARPDRIPREAEYASIRSATGLDAANLASHRVDVAPLPDEVFAGGFAGAIVGGSPFMLTARDVDKSEAMLRTERELARLAEFSLSTGFPVFFTCYGIGVVSEVLGGSVDVAHPEEAGPVQLVRTEAALADPVAAGLPERFLVVTGHKESAPVLPSGATLLATRPECPVQLYRAGEALYASQFHPEATGADFAERARHYRGHGYFPADELDRVTAELEQADVSAARQLLARFVHVFDAVNSVR